MPLLNITLFFLKIKEPILTRKNKNYEDLVLKATKKESSLN
jgi:hypothetical protein